MGASGQVKPHHPNDYAYQPECPLRPHPVFEDYHTQDSNDSGPQARTDSIGHPDIDRLECEAEEIDGYDIEDEHQRRG